MILNQRVIFFNKDQVLHLQQARLQFGDVVKLSFYLHFNEYEAVKKGELFHLEPDFIKPSLIDFTPEKPVEIEARLDLRFNALLGNTEEDAVNALIEADMDSALRQTESWFALNVKQEFLPGFKGGYSTFWADA